MDRRAAQLLPLAVYSLAVSACNNDARKASAFAGTGGRVNDILSGYKADMSEWAQFLECWRSCAIARIAKAAIEDGESLSPDANFIDVGGIFRDSTLATLANVEANIGSGLPESFRHFHVACAGRGWLSIVDGFDKITQYGKSSLYPINEIGRFANADPEGAKIWSQQQFQKSSDEDYYRYGPGSGQLQWRFAGDHVDQMIKVGGLDQGAVVLINPFEICADGEMESWVLSPWHGAVRYRSFAELLQEMALRDISGHGGFLRDAVEIQNSECGRLLVTALTPFKN